MAAALAFYVLFSILPLTLFTVTLLGTVLGDEAAGNQIYRLLVALSGPETAQSAQEFVLAADSLDASWGLSFLGIAILLFSASGMFHHIHRSLNRIWGLSDNQRPIRSRLVGSRPSRPSSQRGTPSRKCAWPGCSDWPGAIDARAWPGAARSTAKRAVATTRVAKGSEGLGVAAWIDAPPPP